MRVKEQKQHRRSGLVWFVGFNQKAAAISQ